MTVLDEGNTEELGPLRAVARDSHVGDISSHVFSTSLHGHWAAAPSL